MKKEKILDKRGQHIDQLIKEKLDAFEPVPPPHVWEGVVAGLEIQQVASSNITRRIIFLAAVTLMLAFLSWLFLSYDDGSRISRIQQNDFAQLAQVIEPSSSSQKSVAEIVSVPESLPNISESQLENNNQGFDQSAALHISDVDVVSKSQKLLETSIHTQVDEVNLVDNVSYQDNKLYFKQSLLKFGEQVTLTQWDSEPTLLLQRINKLAYQADDFIPELDNSSKVKSAHHWTVFAGLSTEFVLTSYDSVTVLNSYSINIEPIYHLNNHLFVRFGAGVSFARDRGFAKLDYISKDYMGSYDDVYDVSFDSVNGQVVPTYHTKTVEVWDSIQHIVVSEVTNKYTYFQIPVMFGYRNSFNQGLNWYVFGGPAINFQMTQSIDEPHPAEKYIEIIDLQNKLPERNQVYFQIWLGAGIEYKLNKRVSMAVEPGFRYYINSIYDKEGYNKPISAFSLKVGAVIHLK